MSHSGKPSLDPPRPTDTLSNRLRDSLKFDSNNNNKKPDFRELDLGSPVSPLRTRHATAAAASSSSGSSGSVSGRNPVTYRSGSGSGPTANKSHSGELSPSSESSPSNCNKTRPDSKPGHRRSSSGSAHPLIYSGQTVNSSPRSNLLPAGNICPSGKILKPTAVVPTARRPDVLGSGSGYYGHGSIMRGGSGAKTDSARTGGGGGSGELKRAAAVDPEELKRAGNEYYRRGNFSEALGLYDQAVSLSPGNAAYRSNRAAALVGLGRIGEAVRECEEAVKLDANYSRAHHRLGSLFVRLGQVENARSHLCFQGLQPDAAELRKLEAVEKHLKKCTDARRVGDWKSVLREIDSTVAAGADFSPQLSMCRAEALLKLHQIDDAESILSNTPKLDTYTASSQSKFFGMVSEAYTCFVSAQIEMALGRFENAVIAVEKAGKIDPRNLEFASLLQNVRMVVRARSRGNDLFKSERFTEACSAYGDGLRLDPSNSVLYCNRAACWFKLGKWEHSIEDCNQALCIKPNYSKALLRRAASHSKLERWVDAIRDYEVLRRELPDNNEVAESLFHAQVASKQSRGEEVYNMKFGGEVEDILSLEQFRAAIGLPGVSVVHFKAASNMQCKQISPFVDMLCTRYPSLNFIKVDIEENSAIANTENVKIVPTFKIYRNSSRVKEMVCPTREMLEHSVRHYSF